MYLSNLLHQVLSPWDHNICKPVVEGKWAPYTDEIAALLQLLNHRLLFEWRATMFRISSTITLKRDETPVRLCGNRHWLLPNIEYTKVISGIAKSYYTKSNCTQGDVDVENTFLLIATDHA